MNNNWYLFSTFYLHLRSSFTD